MPGLKRPLNSYILNCKDLLYGLLAGMLLVQSTSYTSIGILFWFLFNERLLNPSRPLWFDPDCRATCHSVLIFFTTILKMFRTKEMQQLHYGHKSNAISIVSTTKRLVNLICSACWHCFADSFVMAVVTSSDIKMRKWVTFASLFFFILHIYVLRTVHITRRVNLAVGFILR